MFISSARNENIFGQCPVLDLRIKCDNIEYTIKEGIWSKSSTRSKEKKYPNLALVIRR